jgi:hypothetical protein
VDYGAELIAWIRGAPPRTRAADARTVPDVLRWLAQQDRDLEWSWREASRLHFACWLIEHGRLAS